MVDTQSDNVADMVPSQGGTSVSSHVQYEYKTHGYGQRYVSAIVVQRCSNLVRANVLPTGTQDFDMVNAITNLVVQANKWSCRRVADEGAPHWRHYADHTARTLRRDAG